MQNILNQQPHSQVDQQNQNLFGEQNKGVSSNQPVKIVEVVDKTIMEIMMQKINIILTALVVLVIIVLIFLPSPNEDKVGWKKVAPKPLQNIKQDDKQEEDIYQVFDGSTFEDQKKPAQMREVKMQRQQISHYEQDKQKYHSSRTKQFNLKQKEKQFEYLKLAEYNLNVVDKDNDVGQSLFEDEQEILEKKYQISEYKEQISICAVVYSHPTQKPFSHQYVIESIYNQNYHQYSIVFIADNYTQQQIKSIKQYINKKDTSHRIKLIWSEERKYFLQSTIGAIQSECMNKKITVLVGGSDELLGKQVFKLLNTMYRRYNLNMAYGNFLQYHQIIHQIELGFSSSYSPTQKKQGSYRQIGQKFGKVISFKTSLISFINYNDLKDDTGDYYKQAGDYALIYPLLELSCGRIHYIPQYNYLYYEENLGAEALKIQTATGAAIKSKRQYKCFKQYA